MFKYILVILGLILLSVGVIGLLFGLSVDIVLMFVLSSIILDKIYVILSFKKRRSKK